ncbi:hypothetical protein PTSG_13080 [Salpingoeca rosetta]|uniref:Uncharacterized protein n=1 Tax=Salpingoeca rosetta (strain ATCC 50818 / BSB-021) TaxID=946362 RepID=F2URY1_SALR5|nr:uncharacterized protein PTSG_13080 [Salpingoeca rosetta]EGD80386.1 hypothetical protein PTSG_13080 [Salpingoeca rosetta]|eukprot:XP_004988176.1 hypothetical protein PTSG_13080 [Salpingoeca rosetta]
MPQFERTFGHRRPSTTHCPSSHPPAPTPTIHPSLPTAMNLLTVPAAKLLLVPVLVLLVLATPTSVVHASHDMCMSDALRMVTTVPWEDSSSEGNARWESHDVWSVGRAPCSCEEAIIERPIDINDSIQARMTQLTLMPDQTLTLNRGGEIVITNQAPDEPCPVIEQFDVSDFTATVFEATWQPSNDGGKLRVHVDGDDEEYDVAGTTWTGTIPLDNTANTTFTLEVASGTGADRVVARKSVTVPRAAPVIWAAPTSGEWSTGANWIGARPPCSDQHARAALNGNNNDNDDDDGGDGGDDSSGAYDITVTQDTTVRSFTWEPNSALVLTADATFTLAYDAEVDDGAECTDPGLATTTIASTTTTTTTVFTTTTTTTTTPTVFTTTTTTTTVPTTGTGGTGGVSTITPGSTTSNTFPTTSSNGGATTTTPRGGRRPPPVTTSTSTSDPVTIGKQESSASIAPVAGAAGGGVVVIIAIILIIVFVRRKRRRLVVGDYAQLDMTALDMKDAPFSSYFGPVKLAHHDGNQLWCFTLRQGASTLLRECMEKNIRLLQSLQRELLPASMLG